LRYVFVDRQVLVGWRGWKETATETARDIDRMALEWSAVLVCQISGSHGTRIKIYKTVYIFHIMGRTWTQHDVLREYLDIKRQEVTGQWIKLH